MAEIQDWFCFLFIGIIILLFLLLFGVTKEYEELENINYELNKTNNQLQFENQILSQKLENEKEFLLNQIQLVTNQLYEKDLHCEVKLLNLTLEYQKAYHNQQLFYEGVYI